VVCPRLEVVDLSHCVIARDREMAVLAAAVGLREMVVTESTNYTKLSKKITHQSRRFSKLKPV
jgi:hypothetical protein